MNALQEMKGNKTYEEWIQSLDLERGRGSPQGGSRSSEADWLHALRRKAYERFKTLGFPNRKSEAWKYLHLEPLLKTSFALPARQTELSAEKIQEIKKSFLASNENRLVFVNGRCRQDLSAAHLPEGSKLQNLGEALKNGDPILTAYLGRGIENETNAFTALNASNFQEGVYLSLAKDARVENPIELIFVAADSGSPLVFYPRIFVFLETGAQAEVVTHYLDLTRNVYFMNAAAEIYLGKNTKLRWTNVHLEGSGANSFLNTQCHLQEKSVFERAAFFHGGALTRDEVNVDFEAENASCALSGLAALSGNSQVFHHATVRHRAGHCTSRQVYKNILAGRAQAEFNSLVHVLRDAPQSNSEQLDKNLLLSDSARAYSRPQLRIDNDDVQCNHGATTGQLAKDELFYLQSRGLDKNLARQVLIFSFAQEVLDKILFLPLRRRLEQWAQATIQGMIKNGKANAYDPRP